MSDSQGKRSDPISISSGGGGHSFGSSFWDKLSQSAPTKFFSTSQGSSSSPPLSPIGNSPPTPTDKTNKKEWDKFVRKKSLIIDSAGCGW